MTKFLKVRISLNHMQRFFRKTLARGIIDEMIIIG